MERGLVESRSRAQAVIMAGLVFSETRRLDKAGLLCEICKNFAGVDLHPDAVPDRVMSNLYEHLIRRFGYGRGNNNEARGR